MRSYQLDEFLDPSDVDDEFYERTGPEGERMLGMLRDALVVAARDRTTGRICFVAGWENVIPLALGEIPGERTIFVELDMGGPEDELSTDLLRLLYVIYMSGREPRPGDFFPLIMPPEKFKAYRDNCPSDGGPKM